MSSLLEMTTSSWRIQRCFVFEFQKWNNLIANDFFVGASANSCCSMLGLRSFKNVAVKKNYLSLFRPRTLLVFFVKGIKFAQTGNLLFDGHQFLLVIIFGKKNLSVCSGRNNADFEFQ